MRLSAQQEYGLRCMVQMARDQTSGCVNIVDIADREALSGAYVAKLLGRLRKAGFVKSIRGVNGGYRLTRASDEIRVGEVLAALGDQMFSSNHCRRYSGHARDCVHIVNCGGRAMLMGLDRLVSTYLAQFTLSDLVHPEHEVIQQVNEHVRQLSHLVELSSDQNR